MKRASAEKATSPAVSTVLSVAPRSPSADDALKAITSISDGVITVDLNKQITFMNQAAETLTGWSYGEAIGRFGDEIFKIKDSTTKEFS